MPAFHPLLFRIESPFDGRLAVSSRPNGWQHLEASINVWRQQGVGLVISMMEPEESQSLGLGRQPELCADHGIQYVNCPVEDHGIPDQADMIVATADLALAALTDGRTVVTHCFAGLGRSPLMAAAILVRHGLASNQAWQSVSKARGTYVPEREAQWTWLSDLESGLRPIS